MLSIDSHGNHSLKSSGNDHFHIPLPILLFVCNLEHVLAIHYVNRNH